MQRVAYSSASASQSHLQLTGFRAPGVSGVALSVRLVVAVMTSRTERTQIFRVVIFRLVVEVGDGQDYPVPRCGILEVLLELWLERFIVCRNFIAGDRPRRSRLWWKISDTIC